MDIDCEFFTIKAHWENYVIYKQWAIDNNKRVITPAGWLTHELRRLYTSEKISFYDYKEQMEALGWNVTENGMAPIV